MSTQIGRRAETQAAKYLLGKGYVILAQNWRTRWCEIDIIASRKKVVYFVEVKYRRSYDFGGGLDYITAKKFQQMRFAAEIWLSDNQKQSTDYRLAAIELIGPDYRVSDMLELE